MTCEVDGASVVEGREVDGVEEESTESDLQKKKKNWYAFKFSLFLSTPGIPINYGYSHEHRPEW